MAEHDFDGMIRIGRRVFVLLAIATVLEFVVAVSGVGGALALLAAIALVKAWLIVDSFMHVRQLRSEEQA